MAIDIAEQRFCWLLKQRGYHYLREDKLQDRIRVCKTRPDFYIEAGPSWQFLAEVESFEQLGPLRQFSGAVMALDPLPILKRFRTAVRHASRQLKPYTQLNMPMIAVLDDWRQVGLPTNVGDLWDALFRRIDGLPLLNARHHVHLSAIAWNLPEQRYLDDAMKRRRRMYVRMIHNPFAPVPFPLGIFRSQRDEHYRLGGNGLLVRVSAAAAQCPHIS